jgi:DNA polymerase delta subunit OB-fold domain
MDPVLVWCNHASKLSNCLLVSYLLLQSPDFQRPFCPRQIRRPHSPSSPSTSRSSTSMPTYISSDCGFLNHVSRKKLQKSGRTFVVVVVRHLSVENRPGATLDSLMPPRKGSPKLVPRVLDVIKGQVCLIIGTVYMDMPLKPNVLEDIGRDVSRDRLRNSVSLSY